jgi:hypothetical protein
VEAPAAGASAAAPVPASSPRPPPRPAAPAPAQLTRSTDAGPTDDGRRPNRRLRRGAVAGRRRRRRRRRLGLAGRGVGLGVLQEVLEGRRCSTLSSGQRCAREHRRARRPRARQWSGGHAERRRAAARWACLVDGGAEPVAVLVRTRVEHLRPRGRHQSLVWHKATQDHRCTRLPRAAAIFPTRGTRARCTRPAMRAPALPRTVCSEPRVSRRADAARS